LEDIAWFLPDGTEMGDDNWNNDFAKSLGIFMNGKGLHYVDPRGEDVFDDNFYLIFNAHDEPLDYKLPEKIYSKEWGKLLDTSEDKTEEQVFGDSDTIKVNGRSIVLLKHPIIK